MIALELMNKRLGSLHPIVICSILHNKRINAGAINRDLKVANSKSTRKCQTNQAVQINKVEGSYKKVVCQYMEQSSLLICNFLQP